MTFLKKASKYLIDSDYRFIVNANHGLLNSMPDADYLKRRFRIKVGYELNLENPHTYNEKIQWLKLNDRNPLYTKLVDKYEVKSYVSSAIGEQYVIPSFGVWEHFEDIDISGLPAQFVLKCTHDSGGLVICKDKATFDINRARKKITKCLNTIYYYKGREWPYKNVKPRVLAEAYREDPVTGDLRDYKIFVFNGVAKALFIATDRQTLGEETKFDFFDMNGNHLPFTNGHPNAQVLPALPKHLDEMRGLAEKLGANIPHVRVDFYEVGDQVLFGEMTFAHWGGFTPFEPKEWDYKFGSWIDIP